MPFVDCVQYFNMLFFLKKKKKLMLTHSFTLDSETVMCDSRCSIKIQLSSSHTHTHADTHVCWHHSIFIASEATKPNEPAAHRHFHCRRTCFSNSDRTKPTSGSNHTNLNFIFSPFFDLMHELCSLSFSGNE